MFPEMTGWFSTHELETEETASNDVGEVDGDCATKEEDQTEAGDLQECSSTTETEESTKPTSPSSPRWRTQPTPRRRVSGCSSWMPETPSTNSTDMSCYGSCKAVPPMPPDSTHCLQSIPPHSLSIVRNEIGNLRGPYHHHVRGRHHPRMMSVYGVPWHCLDASG
eukprot:scaffold15910_cov139-Skeletonema_dohrnii-CCMP3373.AAC.1